MTKGDALKNRFDVARDSRDPAVLRALAAEIQDALQAGEVADEDIDEISLRQTWLLTQAGRYECLADLAQGPQKPIRDSYITECEE